MKAKPARHLVTVLPGIVGATYHDGELLHAVELAARAKALGFEGEIVTVFDDDTLRPFDPTAKAWGAELPASPFAGDAEKLPARKIADVVPDGK